MKRRNQANRWEEKARYWTPLFLGVVWFSGFVCFASGCGEERRERRRRVREAVADFLTTSPEKAAAFGERPPVAVGATAAKILAETKAAYSNAKYYSDAGRVEIVCEKNVGTSRDRFSIRVPCSFAFAKPNYFRLRVGSGEIRSDGETLRGEIFDPAFSDERLELPAPMVLTSIKELYPDAKLAEATNLRVPTNLFWAPPQTIWLLAKDPLKTFVPNGATVELEEPEYLPFDDSRSVRDRFERSENEDATVLACDRVRVSDADGTRVFWIDRKSKAVARIDLPIERFAVPDGVDRVCELRMEFPNQTLSDVAPNAPNAFRFSDVDAGIRRVDRFLPPEFETLGKRFPNARLRSLDADFPVVRFDDERSFERPTLLCLWSAGPSDLIGSNRAARNAAALRDLKRAARLGANGARLDFIAVNVDAANVSDETVRREYAANGATAPLCRLDPVAFDDADFPTPATPSTVLVDERGIVRAWFSTPILFAQSRRRLVRALVAESGSDAIDDERAAYFAEVKRFADFVANADETDLYRDAADSGDAEKTAVPPRQYPKTFGLREAWRFDGLYAPANPLAVSASDRNFVDDEKKCETPPIPTADAPVSSSTGESATEFDVVPLVAQELPQDLLVVPCDGNALAILSAQGNLIRKTTPSAAVGEPISFVRTVRYGSESRFYVASARLQSRKIHRFDENFNDLGTLDVGRFGDRRVGDARFVDADGDGTPELAFSLVGDPTTNATAPSGLYVVEAGTPKIRWKDESVVEPFCLGVRTRAERAERRVLATSRSEGVVGAIVENDAGTGARLAEFRAPGDATELDAFLTFAVSDATASGESNVAALLASPNSDAIFFVGVGSDGSILWRNRLDVLEAREGQMERIVSGDLDDDGIDEWIVATPDGVVRFFASDGKPLDVFQYGEEISGVCVARWGGRPYLIVADLNQVVAWKIEKRR